MTIKDLARYFHQPPDTLGPEHIRQYQADLGLAKYTFPDRQQRRPSALHFPDCQLFPHSPEFKIHRLEGSTTASFKSLYRKRSGAGPSCLRRYSRRRILPDTARRLLTT